MINIHVFVFILYPYNLFLVLPTERVQNKNQQLQLLQMVASRFGYPPIATHAGYSVTHGSHDPT